MGSMAVARRAGIRQASAATAIRTIDTESIIHGSRVRDNTVEAYRRQGQPQKREGSEEHGNEPPALKFGLAAYAFTSSAQTATAIGDALEAGMVGVNSVLISTPETPFGGIKDSGYGHEGGIEGLEAYMVRKFISQA